jgi:hypothetical protein
MLAARSEQIAVWGHGQVFDPLLVPGETSDLSAGRYVPEAQRPILPSRDNPLAVWQESYTTHEVPVAEAHGPYTSYRMGR